VNAPHALAVSHSQPSAKHLALRDIAQGVIFTTEKLVDAVLSAKWLVLPDLLAQRRFLLECAFAAECSAEQRTSFEALSQAVAESDAALIAMVAEERRCRGDMMRVR